MWFASDISSYFWGVLRAGNLEIFAFPKSDALRMLKLECSQGFRVCIAADTKEKSKLNMVLLLAGLRSVKKERRHTIDDLHEYMLKL